MKTFLAVLLIVAIGYVWWSAEKMGQPAAQAPVAAQPPVTKTPDDGAEQERRIAAAGKRLDTKRAREKEEAAAAERTATISANPLGLTMATGEIGVLHRRLRVIQIHDEKNAIVEYGAFPDSTWIWVSGWSTQDWADNELLTLSGAVQVAGVQRYTTPLGTVKTLKVIRPYAP